MWFPAGTSRHPTSLQLPEFCWFVSFVVIAFIFPFPPLSCPELPLAHEDHQAYHHQHA
jgi:hypothetical protein